MTTNGERYSMWLARPVYESLPYLYGLAGALLMSASWFVKSVWSVLLLIAGGAALVAGLVIWLKRRDYRAQQAEYDSRSLDE